MKKIVHFLKDIYNNKNIIYRMSHNDFKAKYSNSFLGMLWAYIQPLLTIIVFWVVFQMGFKNPPIEGIPYITWFVPAYVPWLYFSDILVGTTNCLQEYSYLVKKVKFKVSILPIVKIISALYVHIFFIAFIFVINILYGNKLTIYSIQFLYYSVALVIFGLGLGSLLASLTVFFKDISQVVNVILQIGFWVSPILWNVDQMQKSILAILKLNPLYYIINGYRESFIGGVGFWEHPYLTIYFWCITLLILIVGMFVFKKTRPFFADEL